MATLDDSGLLAIDVGTDDYAETAARDTPSTVDRTFQSEEDFQKQKASYSAKIQNGNNIAELYKAVPALQEEKSQSIKLGKKDVMLLGYAVAEMYYDREYENVLKLCERVEAVCEVDKKLGESLARWKEKCSKRIEAQTSAKASRAKD